jgi:hypothetical protein
MVILIMKTIKRQKNKKLITLVIIIVSTLLIYAATAYMLSLWPFSKIEANEKVNHAGISTEDNSNNDGKEPIQPSELPNTSKDTDGNSSADDAVKKLTANVGVAFASVAGENLEVRAFTTSEIKGDAVCTATATNGSETVNGTSKSFIDATTSQCHPILIPLSSIKDRSGEWKVSVKYESSKYSGQSPSYEVNLNENQ